METPLTEQEIRSFVGPKADYYLEKWADSLALKDESYGAGFNWAAFFLSGLWLPYRKMYLVTLIFYGIILAESVLEDLVFIGILDEPEPPPALGRMVGLAIAIVCGWYGNRWYLSHTRAKIAELRGLGEEDEAYMQVLAKQGGRSLAASLGIFLSFMVIMAGVVMATDFLFAKG
jgi:hypothetical protein